MKKNLFPLLALLLTFCGCSTQDEPTVEPSKEAKVFTVSMGLFGEITSISDSPLTRAATNDLYAIQVYSRPDSAFSGGVYQEEKRYAYGLFDDKALMTIKLMEGYKYRFECTMVPNGKNKIYHYNTWDGNNSYYYSAPFDKPLVSNGGFTYSTDNGFSSLNNGWSYVYTDSMNMTSFQRPNIDRYYGKTENYVPTQNGTVTIDMKRMVFGVKLVAEGLESGKLLIQIENAPIMTLTAPNKEIQDIFTFQNLYSPISWTYDGITTAKEVPYYESIPLSINWVKADGVSVPIASQNIKFSRNQLTTVTVKVADNSTNNGIGITTESTGMIKGDSIVISGGTTSGSVVNPS